MWTQLITKVLEILIVNIILSGDNALVIGVTTLRLPVLQRRKAVFIGAGISIFLRIWLTLFAGALLTLPYLQVVGGILLCYIAWTLIRNESQQDLASDAVKSQPQTLFRAILAIVLADVMMSVDNVVALAGIAAGNEVVLMFGLIVSIGLIMFASTFIAEILVRRRIFKYVGAFIIVWVAGGMIASDPMAVHVPHLLLPFLTIFIVAFLYGIRRVFRASE